MGVVYRKFNKFYLLIFSILLISLSYGQIDPNAKSIAYKTQINILSEKFTDSGSYLVELEIYYLNQTTIENYVTDPNNNGKKVFQNYYKYLTVPLNNAKLYFTLNGGNVSSDRANPKCNPAISNEDGYVLCEFSSYQDSSGQFISLNSLSGCSVLEIKYEGEFRKDIEFKPSYSALSVCPKKNGLFSMAAIVFPILNSNAGVFCFPVLIILGILIASMYYSGRSPLSLFDLTTPRLPKPKISKISSGQTAIAIRSAAKTYIKIERKTKNDIEKILTKDLSKPKKKEARKKLDELFKKMKKDLSEGKIDSSTTSEYQSKLLQLFKEFHGDKINKQTARFVEFSSKLLLLYAFSNNSRSQMSAARAPSKGPIKRFLNKRITELTGLVEPLDSFLSRIPLVRGIPIFPSIMKGLDYIGQRRTAKSYYKALRARALGHLAYLALTKKEDGERTLHAGGKVVEKLFTETRLKDVAQKLFKWDFKQFMERHDIDNKTLTPLHPFAYVYKEQLEHSINSLSLIVDEEEIKQKINKAKKEGKITDNEYDHINNILKAIHDLRFKISKELGFITDGMFFKMVMLDYATFTEALQDKEKKNQINNILRNANINVDLNNQIDRETFEKQIKRHFLNKIIREIEKEDNAKRNPSEEKGLLSKLQEKSKELAQSTRTISGPTIAIGEDPAGSLLAQKIADFAKKFAEKSGNKELLEFLEKNQINSLTDFENLLHKGPLAIEFIEILNKVASNRQAFIDSFTELDKNAKTKLSQELSHILDSYEKLSKALDNGNVKKEIAKKLNLDPNIKKEELMQILYGLSHAPDPASQNHLRDIVKKYIINSSKKDDKVINEVIETIKNSSLSSFVFLKLLEQTFVDLSNLGANIIKTSAKLDGKSLSNKEAKELFVSVARMEQVYEYSALREKHAYGQYEKDVTGQWKENLIFGIQRLNLVFSQAINNALINKGISKSASSIDAVFGNYKNIFENMLNSYATQKVFYKNLINKESIYFDKKFNDHVSKLGGKFDEFDADAFLALQKRGIKFKDFAKGLPYIIHNDGSAAIPLLEFDPKYANFKDLIYRKDKAKEGQKFQDYMPLLARVGAQDFGSEVVNLIFVKEENGKLKKINPRDVPLLSNLMVYGKFTPGKTKDISKIIATEQAPFKVVSHLDYDHAKEEYHHHAAEKSKTIFGKFYHKGREAIMDVTSKVSFGIQKHSFAIFYEDLIAFRQWYAAQAKVRQMLYQIDSFSSEQLVSGADRLNTSNLFLSQKGEIKNKVSKIKAEIGEENFEKFRALVEGYSHSFGANWLRKLYRKTDKETAEFQSIAFGAKCAIKALDEMYSKNLINKSTYSFVKRELEEIRTDAYSSYKQIEKENKWFNKMLISYTGSHTPHTYYGSVRNFQTMILGLLVPSWRYETGLLPEASMAIESTAMRSTEYNRGGRKGAEYYEQMNMNTGQGIYENIRWWSTSMYDRSLIFPVTLGYIVHETFLPLAATFYRHQIGLSSYLQRTKLEVEWGKPRIHPLWLIGLGKDTSDRIGKILQESSDYSGLSDFFYALRNRTTAQIDSEGNVVIKRPFRFLDRFGVESGYLASSTQWYSQNLLQDRVLAAISSFKMDDVIKEKGKTVYYNPENYEITSNRNEVQNKQGFRELTVKEAFELYQDLSVKISTSKDELLGNEKEAYQKISKLLDNLYSVKFKDERPEIVQTGKGAGNYFNKDGSRLRFPEIFQYGHMNTWRQIIPGMTEVDPWGRVFLSPTTTKYYFYDMFTQNKRMDFLKNAWSLKYDEKKGDFVLYNLTDTFSDTMRPSMELNTTALLHLMKFQSYKMQYEILNPYLGIIPGISFVYKKWRQSHPVVNDDDLAVINQELSKAGLDIREINKAINRKWNEWSYVSPENLRPRYIESHVYNRYFERQQLIALASEEEKRNTEIFRRMMLLMNL